MLPFPHLKQHIGRQDMPRKMLHSHYQKMHMYSQQLTITSSYIPLHVAINVQVCIIPFYSQPRISLKLSVSLAFQYQYIFKANNYCSAVFLAVGMFVGCIVQGTNWYTDQAFPKWCCMYSVLHTLGPIYKLSTYFIL